MQYRYHIEKAKWYVKLYWLYLALAVAWVIVALIIGGTGGLLYFGSTSPGLILIFIMSQVRKKKKEYFLTVNEKEITYTNDFIFKKIINIPMKDVIKISFDKSLYIFTNTKKFKVSHKYFHEVDMRQIEREINSLIGKK